jgi:hypothetical protein
MIRKSRLVLALALVAAAVAAPIAQSGATPKVDPLAVGYLIGQGLSPSEVTAWTTGTCSQPVKDASCYAMFRAAAPAPTAVDPLAVGYLIGQGLSPSEVKSWTVGPCSRQSRPASCFAAFEHGTSTPVVTVAPSGSFHWGDAGIGAGAAVGTLLLLGGMGAGLVISYRRRQAVGV